ncbi:MAG TPA: hypothetical protein ENI95_15125 [Chloroflexi bacterium]|nr:hypothetical protein [Chloroflexota bacterium]
MSRPRLWRIAALILVLALIVPATGALAASPGQETGVTALTTARLVIRSGPGREYQDIGRVPFNTRLPVLGRNASGSWLLIQYGGTRGWIAAWYARIYGNLNTVPVTDETGSAAQGTASGGGSSVTVTPTVGLVIRSGPGTGYRRLAGIPAGVTVPVEGRNSSGTWAFITYNGTQGWIAAWLTRINGDINAVPVTGGQGGSAPAAAPSYAGLPPITRGFMLGGQTHTLDHPDAMRQAGMTWVKFQHKWSPGQDPAILAGRIEQAHASGFRVLLSIPGAAYPSSIDFADYVNFVRGVAALGADGIEVWNEMNLSREWPAGQISPSSYVNNMLAPAYRAIKAANPNTIVIAGALAPTGVDDNYSVWSDARYLAGMRNAGAAYYMDCLGVHYNAGATPPDQSYGHPADPGAGHYSWYFWPTYNLYAGTFPRTQLCYTELGYLSPEGYGSLPPMFWWGSGTSVGEQAAWLARSAEALRSTGRVRLMIVFNVDFTVWGDDPQAGYAIIRPGGGCPACDALAGVMR